jgi:hypothetical protein
MIVFILFLWATLGGFVLMVSVLEQKLSKMSKLQFGVFVVITGPVTWISIVAYIVCRVFQKPVSKVYSIFPKVWNWLGKY